MSALNTNEHIESQPDADSNTQNESRLLFEQLSVVQQALEQFHHSSASTSETKLINSVELKRLEEKAIQIQAERLRQEVLIGVQARVLNIQRENSMEYQIGKLVVTSASSISSVIYLPFRLLRLWLKSFCPSPPQLWGGVHYTRIIEAYQTGGNDSVDRLMKKKGSATAKANAWTFLARELQSRGDTQGALGAAREAFSCEPKMFRLKWLVFRLYEAGEFIEAEVTLSLLPVETDFSASEQRQVETLKRESKKKRINRARTDLKAT